MSWVIKASPVLKIFDPLREPIRPTKGKQEKVKVTPWQGIRLNIAYENVERVGGPEGTTTGGFEDDETYGPRMRVAFPNGHWWIPLDQLEVIGPK